MEELAVQADEIGIDKDNLRVRRVSMRALLRSGGPVEVSDGDLRGQELIVEEIDDVTAKIDALDQIRERLESSLVLIQEEELELDDERESCSAKPGTGNPH
jgi:division protein 1